MIVYHYTTNESLQLIVNSKNFHPSYLNPQMDTAFGEGWYFTDLSPDTTPDDDLQQSLWMRKEPSKCKRYLAFEIDDELLEYCRPHVYRLRIETITDKIIKLNLNYTYTNTGKQAIKFISHGFKKFINKIINPRKTFSIIALIGTGLWALIK